MRKCITKQQPGTASRRSWSGSGYDEAWEYLVLDADELAYLDSLTASERDEMIFELYLVPLREVAVYAIGTDDMPTEHLPALSHASTIWTEDDYDGALIALEGIDRAAYLEILNRAARIIAREIRAWDTEDISLLVDLLKKLDVIADRAGRKAEDYVRMDSLPSAPIPEGSIRPIPCGPSISGGWLWSVPGPMRWRALRRCGRRVRSTPAA